MAPESQNNLRLEIGHVLFIDIVGYSKLLIEEQKERLRQLTDIVLATAQVRESSNEQLVRLPTGDGMAQVFRNSSEEPARCALEIAQALKSHPAALVRMGIHSGPVSEVTDVSGRTNLAGAGINMAQRVMDCGDAGHILLSKHVAEDLEQYRLWRPRLHDLGECEVKHGFRLGLFNLYSDEFGNPALPEKFKNASLANALPAAKSSAGNQKYIFVGGALIAAVAIGLLVFRIVGSEHGAPRQGVSGRAQDSGLSAPVPEKSIAVLPFENLSNEKENAFFADGVQDEILTDLAKAADLKVISRTSVIGYRDTAGRNLRKIGQELGVAHLLEGSVQRAGNRVRVNAQLIDVRTDAHLWAQTYDRDLADVFAIQSEIAMAIADQLQAKLSPNEKSDIGRAPTNNLAAFEFYTHARTLMLNVSFTAVRQDNLQQAINLFNQAVALDPTFFLAYASLAEAHDQLYSLGGDHTPARMALADATIAHLREMRPDAGETHLALARHRYYVLRDYAGARAELAAAARSLPNEPAILSFAGFIDRRAGKWDESLQELNQAIARDPRNIFLMQQTALSYQYLRRYADMAALLDRALSIDPERIETQVARAQVELHWHANTKPLHDVIQRAITRDPSSASVVAENWVNLALCERDASALGQALHALGARPFGQGLVTFQPTFGAAFEKYLQGDAAQFKEGLQTARVKQETVVQQQPNYAAPLAALAVIDAMAGNANDALKEGNSAMELTPVTKDALAGPELTAFFAIACAWSGDKDRAFQNLEVVVQMPCFLSYGQLRLQPYWDPLRGDPRFDKIVASLAPK